MTNSQVSTTFAAALFAGVMALSVLPAPAGAASGATVEEAMSYDGLQKTSIQGVDLAYVRPGASLAGYTQVLLDPVGVAFHKDWNPNRTGSRMKLTDSDRENIRARISKLVNDEFVRTLAARGGYPTVSAPGPNVLRVKADVINVYITAPGVMTAGRTRTYTATAGQMTLVAELFDSQTGEVLARIIDHRGATNTRGRMTQSTSVSNAAEGRIIASRWAGLLRSALDKAQT